MSMYSVALSMFLPFVLFVVWLAVILYLFSLAGRLVRAVETIAQKLSS